MKKIKIIIHKIGKVVMRFDLFTILKDKVWRMYPNNFGDLYIHACEES